MRRMAPPPRFSLTLAVPFTFLAAGCSDVDPTKVDTELSESAATLVQTDLRADRGTIDDRWAAISQTEVPGFAGYWYDQATGEIVVATNDLESESAAREWAVRSPAASDFPGAPIRFDLVSYDFLQLRTWKAAARELLGTDIVYIDADEVQNRLVLGVTPGAVTSQVRARTRELDIPDEGLEFVTMSPMEFDGAGVTGGGNGESTVTTGGSTLTDQVRPTMGGLEVYAEEGSSQHVACTMGFNATLGGESEDDLYFATASHCSTQPWNPDTGFWTQDSVGPRVGRESHDLQPPTGTFSFNGMSYDCTTRPCRFSDVSLVAYDDSIDAGDVDLGRIAVTSEESTTITGRRDVTHVRPVSTIYDGLPIQMLGKVTGRTSGEVTETCFDGWWTGVGWDFRCVYGTDYERAKGDSGGPVYGLIYGGTVALIGTHTGTLQNEGSGPAIPFFSTVAGIEADLGVSLEVCIPTGCETTPHPMDNNDVEIDGPNEVLEFSECVYTAVASDGIPPYSYQWFIDGDSVEVGGESEPFELVVDDIGEDDFLVEVKIDDSYTSTAWAELLVDVSPHHPNCDLGQ